MQERLFYISELIGKELNGTITVDEATVLNEWVNSSVANKTLFDQLHNDAFVKQELEKFDRYDIEKNRAYLMGKLGEEVASREPLVVSPSTPLRIKLWKRIAVAASVVGLLFVGYWLLRPSTTLGPTTDGPSTVAQDVKAPDKNRAQITLADGTTVYLDSAANGELVNVNGVKVVKMEDGRIEYNGHASTSLSTVYNTLSNPRGSKVIDMTLADGSRVWLNTGSSVTYPVVFVGNERNVTITGEAYFEVAPDKAKPFKVSKGDMTVEVLGTHFNVNAYDDNNDIKVTLLEGKIKTAIGNGQSAILKPWQQAIFGNSELSVVSNADIEEVMAWKNDRFMFNSKTVTEIMKEISRWYDVEVKYEGEPGKETFSAIVKRSSNVSQVLEIMKMGGMKFKVENRTITVFK